MALDAVSQIGKFIGTLSKDQDTIKQNISPDDSEAQDQYFIGNNIKITGVMTATKYLYPTNSFIIDHPIYGDIDSSVLNIDGDYDSSEVIITKIV